MKPRKQQSDIDQWKDRVRRMSEEQIVDLFKHYNFRDDLGHPLTNCLDFKELLEMAMECRRAQALITDRS